MGLFSRLFPKANNRTAPQQGLNASTSDENDHSDFDSQLQEILANYPKELAERYPAKSANFLQALVLASQGEDRQALDMLAKLPIGEQDDLFDYELGVLMARHGHEQKACNTMRSCLKQNPDHLLAVETLVVVLVGMKENDQALELILQMLLEDRDGSFCHAQLASLYHIQQDDDLALKHCLEAIKAGHNDPNITLLAATLLEKNNELQQAETLYAQILDGDGEGIGLYLAEFLLRQQRELNKILDTFNTASLQEPDNPRWQLRIAQTKIAQGSKRKGVELLHTVMNDQCLNAALRDEAQTLLEQHS
jgi:tetratricopeptide (TPR) repeat protein